MKFYIKRVDSPSGKVNNFFIITRLSLMFIFAGILQTSANTYGQNITFSRSNISIIQVFKEIKAQAGYDVIWQPNQFNAEQMISVNFKSASLDKVIKECVFGQSMVFNIEDRSIILRKAPSILLKLKQKDSVIYRGVVTDEKGKPLSGATIKISGKIRSTFTTLKGEFGIYGPLKGTLEVTYIGYLTKQITLNGLDPLKSVNISLSPGYNNLGEVNIVSTGYQDLSKERSTGSFESITQQQLQHSNDPNLIKRLEGITTSMNFNNNLTPINSAATTVASTNLSKSPLANLTIRGKNTLNANQISYGNQSGAVLVIIDGVASPYPIDNVNPNDVESITVLKDAAAASIWGARAANGVIVVKTKRGKYDRPVNISFNSNFNITEKLDLFYRKTMSTSDYIDAQVLQFNASKTVIDVPNLNSPQPFVSPVGEILVKQKNGQLTTDQTNSQLNALRSIDVRNDLNKYILRNAATQSYSLGIDGGSKGVAYRVFGGYDKSIQNTVGAGSNRLFLNYNTSFKPLKNLEISAGVAYTVRQTENQAIQQIVSASVGAPFYPYTRLVDDYGNPVSIPYKYRPTFIDLLSSTYGSSIQDLTYNPLKNINEGYYNTTFKNLNFNLGATYKFGKSFSANFIYNYGIGNNETDYLYRKNSFYVRDLITYYTSSSGVKSIPNGSIYQPSAVSTRGQSLRGQLNLNQKWGEKHELNAIAGIEFVQNYSLSKQLQYYGYDENTLFSNNRVNYTDYVPVLFDNGFGPTNLIPYTQSAFIDTRIRTYSTFSNAAYTYNRRYTISGSVRKDMSSEFGAGTNSGGAPFFSFGGKWNIANEDFYKINWLPILQFRSTFGYNGNVNPIVSARQLITYSGSVQDNNLLSASALKESTTNDLLRPEKTGVLNLGLDFGFKNGRISGSIEYYNKKTTDLIAGNPLDPSTGFNTLSYNTANLNGWGTDFTLNTQNIQYGKFSWGSNFLFSYNRVKVVKLFTAAAKTASNVVLGTPSYNEGADLSRLYAYKWAGLDPVTGSPRGYLNGQPTVINNISSYLAVTQQPIYTAKYFGSAVPVYFGSIRNTFRYDRFSISANILYKLGYFFRRPSNTLVNYSQLFGVNGDNAIQPIEYQKRWKKPGDEVFTNVPAQTYPASSQNDLFYQLSDINVEKADHIRLQEINLSYGLNKKKWFLKNPMVYVNISNLGIIWRANKLGLDPDINDYPNPRSYSFGFSANF